MATILRIGGSGGGRRCDATCHEAKEPSCDCVCEGRYHGVGSTHIAAKRLTLDLVRGVWGPDLAEAAQAQKLELCRRLALRAGSRALEVDLSDESGALVRGTAAARRRRRQNVHRRSEEAARA